MLSNPLFQRALPVLKAIEKAGFNAYFVGGCVRDTLLNKPISDIDIATSAYPDEIKRIFKKTVDIGIEHGTVMVIFGGQTYEITTFRVESTYQDYRRPDSVTFVRSLEEDLKRRDLTINALALDRHGKLYDFHNGQQDLSCKSVRCVGIANERFNEDALRMLRSVRFAAQLGFTIEKHTQEAIKQNAMLLQHIAVERQRVEFEKLLMASDRNIGFKVFLDTNLYHYCPELASHNNGLYSFMQTTRPFKQIEGNWAMLAYFLGYCSETVTPFLKKWKLSNAQIDTITTYLNVLSWRQNRQWAVDDLFYIGKEKAIIAEQLAKHIGLIEEEAPIEQLYNALTIKSVKDIVLNGSDIMRYLNKAQGGAYLGDIIEQLRQAILNNKISNNETDIKEWLNQFK